MNNSTFSPLERDYFQAAINGDVKKLINCLEQGVDIDLINHEDVIRCTALLYACINADEMIATELIKRGADFNIATENGSTPLHFVAAKGPEIIAQKLLDKGADINRGDSSGYTPIFQAIANKNVDMMKFLIKQNADCTVTTNNHFHSALHAAANHDNIKCLYTLLRQEGIDIDSRQGLYGETPLYYAIVANLPHNVCALLNHGANINVRNKEGLTPLEYAIKKKTDTNIIQILQEAVAEDFKARKTEFNQTAIKSIKSETKPFQLKRRPPQPK